MVRSVLVNRWGIVAGLALTVASLGGALVLWGGDGLKDEDVTVPVILTDLPSQSPAEDALTSTPVRLATPDGFSTPIPVPRPEPLPPLTPAPTPLLTPCPSIIELLPTPLFCLELP